MRNSKTSNLFVTLTKGKGGYDCTVHGGDPMFTRKTKGLALGENDQVSIGGTDFALGTLVKALISHGKDDMNLAFSEEGQLAIGRHLYELLFADMEKEWKLSIAEGVDLTIITDDEHILRLPWVLLAKGGLFLTLARKWFISVSSKEKLVPTELPESPKMLIVAPEPDGAGGTTAEEHLVQLEDCLGARDPRFRQGRNIRMVRDWDGFKSELKAFQPHLIYYYGHGVGGSREVRLLFEKGPAREGDEIPVVDFAHALRRMKSPPVLVYVNCCRGDAAGFLGVGHQVEDFVPAVVTNRTVARVEVARSQALIFWDRVLLEGWKPHVAVADLYSQLGELDLKLSDARWMNPVVHRHYSEWKAHPPRRVPRTIHDPHWHLKLDRVNQFATVAHQTRIMLREGKLRSHAFIWYGKQGQGVERFHERLTVELEEDIENASIIEIMAEWPRATVSGRAFADVLAAAFGVDEFEDIPDRVRSLSDGVSGQRTLIYVRHAPVCSTEVINPRTLKVYLEWWNREFVPLLQKSQFALLGTSFVVKEPSVFRNAIEKQGIDELDLDQTVIRILDEMERVVLQDLRDFIKTHSIKLPTQHRETLLKRIIDLTGGHYDKTVEQLEELVSQEWEAIEEEESEGGGKVTDNYGY